MIKSECILIKMHVLLIVTCDNCVSERDLSHKLFTVYLGREREETSTVKFIGISFRFNIKVLR